MDQLKLRMGEFDEAERKRRWLLPWSAARTHKPAKRDAAYIEVGSAFRAESARREG